MISLSDQLAYVYRGDTLMAVSTISSGKDEKPTRRPAFSRCSTRSRCTGRRSTTMRRCRGCSASTNTASRFTPATTPALRPATAASACPRAFAKKLYSVTDVGTPVYIGA